MNKSLALLCLDIIDLDPETPDYELIVEEQLKAIDSKVDDYYFLNQYAESQIDMLKKEKDHIITQIQKYENLIERLREKALQALLITKKEKIKSETGHYISRGKSHSVIIDDLTALPDWAVKKEISYTPKKLDIKNALLANEKVPGAKLISKDYATISGPRKLKP